jgi:serralysin
MRLFVSLLVAALVTATLGVASPAGADHYPRTMLGPGDANVSNIGGAALIRMSEYNNHLRITYVADRNALRFRDTRTSVLRSKPDRCHKEEVEVGISVVCTIPPRFNSSRMFVQVWPRLGNDYVDGRTLGSRFRLWVLADAGRDVFYGGAGADFFNGAKGDDVAYAGPGRDWLRGGPGADRLIGGSGTDRISHG